MKCWHCNEELIWGGDHDLEEDAEIDNEHTIVTNLSCNNCNAYVEVYHTLHLLLNRGHHPKLVLHCNANTSCVIPLSIFWPM